MSHVSVFAPASVANISCGFDVLGVCLESVGDILHIEEASKPGIEITEIIGQDLPLEATKNVAGVAGLALLADYGLKEVLISKLKRESNLEVGLEALQLVQLVP